MTWRRQLPVSSPIAIDALVRGAGAAARGARVDRSTLDAAVAERYGAHAALLTDSGTSALVLALRMTAGIGATVALPAYACIDLTAAAVFARVKVRLYDVEPATLGADLDSLARVLRQGVDAVVVAHLYGFPVDVPEVAQLAAQHGATVIEDAAQGVGAALRGTPLGGFGPLSVLSFGRGKGMTSGSGGALLATTPEWQSRVADAASGLVAPARGWRALAAAAAQWALGRPMLYALPSSIPWLQLGEMVYRPAHDPAPLAEGATALLGSALATAEQASKVRRRNADVLERAARAADGIESCRVPPGGVAGYLRFPVLDRAGRAPARELGVLRGYPLMLSEHRELAPHLLPSDVPLPGAAELKRSLFTLPTHHMVGPDDLRRLQEWLRAPLLSSAATEPAVAASRS